MSPEERAKLGKAGTLATEAQAKYAVKTERAMHDELEKWLRMQGIPFVHSRMDKKPTIREGWPDFTCLYGSRIWNNHGRCVCVELKIPGAQLRPEQAECIAELDRASVPTIVATSSKQAIDFVIEKLLR